MRIVSIHLKNIKSHRDTELSFSGGINVLSGANGSGKSTIFQAIGYALFGVNAQDFVSRADRFLTIGTKRGEISVVFEPAPGELYRVTRTVGPAGKWLLAKETAGEFEIEDHANLQETEVRIAALLGLSGNRSLADQFKLVIGPFQNDFLGPFVIRQPTKRQDAFDEILGIDAWRKTFDGTKSLASAIVSKIETLQAELAGKLEQVSILPQKELELAQLKESLGEKHSTLEQRRAGLQQASGRLSALDAQKERIDSVQTGLQGLEERIASGKDHVATQQLLTEQSRTAAGIVAESAAGKKAFDAAEERLKKLREEQQQKLLQEKKLAELDKEQSGIRTALGIETRELAELRTGIEADSSRLAGEQNAHSAGLGKLRQVESELASRLALVKASVSAFSQLPVHNIDKTLPYLTVALDQMALLETQVAERRKLLEKRGPLQAEAAELATRRGELEKAQGERAELAGRRLSLLEGCEKIGAGDCPFFHEPCKNVEAGGGVSILGERINEFDRKIAALDAQVAGLAAKVASAQGAAQELAALEQVRLELEKVAREREKLEQKFAGDLSEIAPAALLGAVQEWRKTSGLDGRINLELQGLDLAAAGSPQQRRAQLNEWSDRWRSVLVTADQALAELLKEAEEPARKCALQLAERRAAGEALEAKKRDLAARTEKISQREKAIETHERRLAAVAEAVLSQQAALSPYSGIDDAIKAAGEELERFKPERERYTANRKAAEELPKRQETLGKYQVRLQEYQGQHAAQREELNALQGGYHDEQHASAKQEREQLVSLVATLTAELSGISESIARVEGEIASLTVIAAEITKKQSAIADLKRQGLLVKYLRNQVFKNVSSQLSERFREEISSRADRIYRCIAESDEELFWGENYQIVLKDMVEGEIRERTDDQLSGGQMMSAVVALRLALLQTIGARIAFFDEPTSNLDAERRENLAKAFRAIDVGQEEVTEHWYDQLFLVSHDVSFTEITDQMIDLDK
jgi:DNA repair protein SbcC/Rad50